jgi:hypothetical protein
VARKEQGKAHTVFWWKNLRGKDNVEYLEIDGRKLQWIFIG